jgi:hypothetical protein
MALDTMSILYLLVGIVVNVIVNSLFVWLAGRALVGAEKAKFTDAIWIVVIGAVIGGILGAFNWGLIGAIISFILWLALIKHFFDCGWVTAFIIAIVAAIIQIVIGFVLALIGLAAFTLGFGL